MTAYNHHLTDDYINAHLADLASSLTEAHARGPHPLQRAIARMIVRIGAWLLPDEPDAAVQDDVIGGKVLVLHAHASGDARKAA